MAHRKLIDRVSFTVRLSKKEHDRLVKYVTSKNTSLSKVGETAIHQYLDKRERNR